MPQHKSLVSFMRGRTWRPLAELALLERERDRLDERIAALRALPVDPSVPVTALGGLPVGEAAARVLHATTGGLHYREIAERMVQGGFHFETDWPVNALAGALTARRRHTGDVERLPPAGVWTAVRSSSQDSDRPSGPV